MDDKIKTEALTLASEKIPTREIIDYIAKSANLPQKFVRQKVEEILSREKPKFSFKLFQRKEEEEKKYFRKLLQTRTLDEVAEIYAEMAIMLERELLLNSFLLHKNKQLQRRIKELEKALNFHVQDRQKSLQGKA